VLKKFTPYLIGLAGLTLLAQKTINDLSLNYETQSKSYILNDVHVKKTSVQTNNGELTALFLLDMNSKSFLSCKDTTGDYKFNKISFGTIYGQKITPNTRSSEFNELSKVCNRYRTLIESYEGVRV
jgi:hypothetical protein